MLGREGGREGAGGKGKFPQKSTYINNGGMGGGFIARSLQRCTSSSGGAVLALESLKGVLAAAQVNKQQVAAHSVLSEAVLASRGQGLLPLC